MGINGKTPEKTNKQNPLYLLHLASDGGIFLLNDKLEKEGKEAQHVSFTV